MQRVFSYFYWRIFKGSKVSILKKLSNPQIKASKSDNKLIHYFLVNGLKACSSSISEISADCDISHATVTRFARKFGFETLKDFKISLAQDLGAQDSDSLSKRSAINLKESCETTAQKLLQLNQTLLSQTAVEIGFESVTKLTREIVGARHVFFFGIGSSGYLARDAARKIASTCSCVKAAYAFCASLTRLIATSSFSTLSTVSCFRIPILFSSWVLTCKLHGQAMKQKAPDVSRTELQFMSKS